MYSFKSRHSAIKSFSVVSPIHIASRQNNTGNLVIKTITANIEMLQYAEDFQALDCSLCATQHQRTANGSVEVPNTECQVDIEMEFI